MTPDATDRAGRDLRPGAGGDQGQATSTKRCEIANGTQYALTGGSITRSPANIARAKRRVPRRQPVHQPQDAPAPWSTGSRSAASSCPASAPRPAGRITCCSSSCRGRSPRTPCAAASPRSERVAGELACAAGSRQRAAESQQTKPGPGTSSLRSGSRPSGWDGERGPWAIGRRSPRSVMRQTGTGRVGLAGSHPNPPDKRGSA